MGTRNLTLVWYKGKWRIAQYGQWDGQPDGQGVRILRFINNLPDQYAGGVSSTDRPTIDNLEALKSALDNDMAYEPTREDLEDIQRDVDKVINEAQEIARNPGLNYEERLNLSQTMMNATKLVAPTLDRDLGAEILWIVAYTKEKLPVRFDREFIKSENCEWAYVLDLDKNVLEVYKDEVDTDDASASRFDDLFSSEDRNRRPQMLKSYTFEDLKDISEETFSKQIEDAYKQTPGCGWYDSDAVSDDDDEQDEEDGNNAEGEHKSLDIAA